MVKITMEGTVKRVYEEEKNGYTKNYIVVEETPDGKYTNVLRFVSKDPANATSGDTVKIEAFVNGREWNGRDGIVYFTDLKVSKMERIGSSVKPVNTDDTPKYAANGSSAMKAFLDNGGDKSDFGLFCKRVTGKASSKEYGCDDWARVIAEAAKPKNEPEPVVGDDDDLPF